MTRVRVKCCDRCQDTAGVLYRVKVNDSEPWIFVCDRCYPSVSQANPDYIYGGTWKARKPR